MCNLLKLETEYNEILKRANKAELYINNKNIDLKIITEKYIPAYNKIVVQLSRILNQIIIYSQDEALNGFNLGGIKC